MDTFRQAVTEMSPAGTPPARERRSVEEKRRIVEQTLVEGASVARVARGHGVNANQVFGWRRLYQAGRLGGASPRNLTARNLTARNLTARNLTARNNDQAIQMLPVRVSESALSPERSREGSGAADSPVPLSLPRVGTIHVELRRAQVRIEGGVDPALLRVLLESLRG